MQRDERTVYVVDDDAAVRESLLVLFRAEGFKVGVFDSGNAFLDVAADGLPFGCVLLDQSMPGCDGLTVQREMAERRLPHPVVMITAHGDVPLALQAVKNGAFDFLEKPFSARVILQTVEAAFAGTSEARASFDEAMEVTTRIASLSAREAEVLQRVVAGLQNKEIARDLGISPRTVETYRGNVMTKLGARTLPELVRLATAVVRP